MNRLLPLTLAALLAAACHDVPTGPLSSGAESAEHRAEAWAGIKVMTRNLYVGADLDPIVAATDPNQVPLLVAQAFQQLQHTNYPFRAKLLAREIARARPHLVGLQEVSLIRIQSPGDLVIGGTTPATTVFLDFLPILLEELSRRGARYRVVAQVQNTDVELPMVTSTTPTFDDVRLTDFDVLLARHDVATENADGRNFAAALPVPGTPIVVRRGFVAVDARVGRVTYRVVNTHLESALELVRQAQAAELLQYLAAETRPIVALGDFNTDAELAEPTYQLIVGSGYADVWRARVGRPTNGLTCCHAADLSNPAPTLSERIDLIFTRNFDLGPVLADVVGDEQHEFERGLWPSDHAGVVARLLHVGRAAP